MICNKIVDENHLVCPNNKYIVDTNVLIYLYGDTALVTETPKLKMMSDKFYKALDVKCKVYIPAIVISEFINKFHRLQFNNMKKATNNRKMDYKKDYRNTEKYKENNKFILKTVNEILKRCNMIEDNFNDTEKSKIFSENDGQDFNDVLIISIANKNDCYLLSADNDSKKIEIK